MNAVRRCDAATRTCAWWLAVVMLLGAMSASAHEVATSHLTISGDGGAPLRAELDLAVRDVALQWPIDTNADGDVHGRELVSEALAIQRLATTAVAARSGAGDCAWTAGAVRIRRYADGAYLNIPLVATGCDRSALVSIALGEWLATDRSHRMLVRFEDSETTPVVLGASDAAYTLDRAGRTSAGTFFVEGVRHILAGYDHLAFVLSLLLPVVVVGGRARAPRDALKRAAVVVTAFTLAHSVTLTLAALELVWPAPSFVEPAIAASIALAALNNVVRVVERRLAWLAGAFGLVHGFGFAGALAELGLPVSARVSSLLAFNLGVEFGQLAVVVVALPVLSLCARWRHYTRWVMAPASLAIAALGGFWLVARVA